MNKPNPVFKLGLKVLEFEKNVSKLKPQMQWYPFYFSLDS
jgi:hypothetical protein